MQVFVYKSEKKQDHYLYLACKHKDAEVPTALLGMLGELSLVVELDLSSDTHLAQARADDVLADIDQQGFYLQMPKRDMRAEEDRVFS